MAVTLVADRWISDTTSDGAAGLWEVGKCSCLLSQSILVLDGHATNTNQGPS